MGTLFGTNGGNDPLSTWVWVAARCYFSKMHAGILGRIAPRYKVLGPSNSILKLGRMSKGAGEHLQGHGRFDAAGSASGVGRQDGRTILSFKARFLFDPLKAQSIVEMLSVSTILVWRAAH